jgi:hypothetical protein
MPLGRVRIDFVRLDGVNWHELQERLDADPRFVSTGGANLIIRSISDWESRSIDVSAAAFQPPPCFIKDRFCDRAGLPAGKGTQGAALKKSAILLTLFLTCVM